MGQILHGSATTTYAIRAAIQRSKAPLKELAAQHGLNAKTVAKWRKRAIGSAEHAVGGLHLASRRDHIIEEDHPRNLRGQVRRSLSTTDLRMKSHLPIRWHSAA